MNVIASKKQVHEKLMVAANMPPLYHTLPGETFNYKNSEVLKWLADRPALIEYLFDRAVSTKQIVYNKYTGQWRGVDWEEEE